VCDRTKCPSGTGSSLCRGHRYCRSRRRRGPRAGPARKTPGATRCPRASTRWMTRRNRRPVPDPRGGHEHLRSSADQAGLERQARQRTSALRKPQRAARPVDMDSSSNRTHPCPRCRAEGAGGGACPMRARTCDQPRRRDPSVVRKAGLRALELSSTACRQGRRTAFPRPCRVQWPM